MIYELKNPLLLPKIKEMAKNVNNINDGDLNTLLVDCVSNENAVLVVNEDRERRITGFLCASVERWRGENVVFIQLCTSDTKDKAAKFNLLTHAKVWGKRLGLKSVVIIVDEPREYEKMYKFNRVGAVLRRSIENGNV